MPDLKDVLKSIDAELEVIEAPKLEHLVHWRNGDDIAMHQWFRYREAFSPHLIDALSLGNRILDPFCGCGSIMLGAARTGRKSTGIDVNPLAVFVGRVKLQRLTADELEGVAGFLGSFRKLTVNSQVWSLPTLRISRKLFEPEILEAILKLRTAIESVDSPSVRDFLFLGWLAILEDVGNFYKEGNGIKYKNVKRTKSGYVRRPEGVWQLKLFGEDQTDYVFRKYKEQLSMMLEDTSVWRKGLWSHQQIMQGDALSMPKLVNGQYFDDIVFSPPYANRFDYFESLKVELWFGNFVDSYTDLGDLRKSSVRSHLGADLNRPVENNSRLERLIDLMDRDSSSWRMGVPSLLRGYFYDLHQILKHCKEVLKGGRCFIVIGNSAFGGVVFPTDSLVAHLGLQAGFTSVKLMEVRHLTVAPQQRNKLIGLENYMRETIVVLSER